MDRKENKGGNLSNEQVEQELKVRSNNGQQGGYQGSQDTGDTSLRDEDDGTGDGGEGGGDGE